MPWGASAASGIFIIDMFFKPLVKTFEKFPLLALLIVCLIYGFIGYHVVKSAFLADH